MRPAKMDGGTVIKAVGYEIKGGGLKSALCVTRNVVEALTVADVSVVLRIRHQYVQQFVFHTFEENIIGKGARQIDFDGVH